MCVCVCVCPAQGRGRDEGGRRGGAEQPEEESQGDQAEGGLSPYLCIDSAQDGNEERMASDNSRLWLQISAITPDTKHALQFYHVVVCVGPESGVHGLRIHTEQIMWGEALKPLPVEPSVCGAMGWPVETMDVAMKRPGMVRLRSC